MTDKDAWLYVKQLDKSSEADGPLMKNHIRVLRAELGWSQAALAERLGVSRQTVNAEETGKYDPSLPLAFAIARVFGRAIEEIFDDEQSD